MTSEKEVAEMIKKMKAEEYISAIAEGFKQSGFILSVSYDSLGGFGFNIYFESRPELFDEKCGFDDFSQCLSEAAHSMERIAEDYIRDLEKQLEKLKGV